MAIDASGNAMSRFLITTADESTWVFDRPVLFLGHWCLNPSREHIWSKMDYVVFNPKFSASALDEHFATMNLLYDDLLTDLSAALNGYHRCDHSKRYWTILIGPWLRFFCNQIMFRWTHLNGAISRFEIKDQYSEFNVDVGDVQPHNFVDYQRLSNTDTWSQYMYSKLLILRTPAHQTSTPDTNNLSRRVTQQTSVITAVNKGRSIGKEIIIADSYLPRKSEFILKLMARKPSINIPRITAPSAPQDFNKRACLEFSGRATNGLHLTSRALIADQLPTAYLEGYPQLIESAKRLRLATHPKTIFTSNRHLYDDVFNVWVAQATELGSTYVIGQHGGNYGSSLYKSHAELHEEQVADVHLTWGWGMLKNQIKGPCLKTIGLNNRNTPRGQRLLFVGDHMWTHPRSLFCDISETDGYLEYVSRCINALPDGIRRDVQLRIHPGHANFGLSQLEWWQQNSPETVLDNGKSDFRKLIETSRLVVSTSNQTTFLQTLNLNIPTLITWDQSYCKLRVEATPYFDLLEQVGIFHRSAESFASHLCRHWDEIEIWWEREDVQAARLSFCENFSRIEKHPLRFLLRKLNWPEND